MEINTDIRLGDCKEILKELPLHLMLTIEKALMAEYPRKNMSNGTKG